MKAIKKHSEAEDGTGNTQETKERRTKGTWKRVTITGAAGYALGYALTSTTIAERHDTETEAQEQPEIQPAHPAEVTVEVHGDIAIAETVNDDMSFGEAFATARAALGPGGVFTWHGNTYNTYIKEEWEAMTEEEVEEYTEAFDIVETGEAEAEPLPMVAEEPEEVIVLEATLVDEPDMDSDTAMTNDGGYNADVEVFASETTSHGDIEYNVVESEDVYDDTTDMMSDDGIFAPGLEDHDYTAEF